MPTILRERGYSVKLFVAEQGEPAHVHVWRDDAQVKAWLSPVRLTRNRGFRPQELSEIFRILKDHESQLLEAYHELHGR
jgi:hypothetical protein